MGTGWARRTVVVSFGIVAALAPSACSSGGDAEAESTLPPINPVVITSVVPTSTTTPIDPQLVTNCVDYVQFGAFTQNALLTALWDAAGQNAGVLRDNCEALALSDMAALQSLSDGWVAMQASLATAPTSSTTSTTTSVATAPRPTTTLPPVVTDPPATEPVITEPPTTLAPPVEPTTTTL
jgi:hypothetical protein